MNTDRTYTAASVLSSYSMAAVAAAGAAVGLAAAVQYLSPEAREWMNNAHPAVSLGLVFASCIPFGYLFARALLAK
jgi:hypothetical protein